MLLLLSTWTLLAADPHGMDPALLARIPKRMQQFVDNGKVAGVVTLIQRNGQRALLEAVGWQDREAKTPMKTDSIFQIASMTKPVTGTAVMILADEGRLALTDPVEKHLPEFRGLHLKDGRKPSRAVTIRDLMTHTSGMSGGAPDGIREINTKRDRTLAEAVLVYSQQPLEGEPGERWRYSNMGLATLGRIVEVVSGMDYPRFLEQRIFQPLGMKDTFFYPPKEKHSRIAAMYAYDNGKLTRAKDFDLYREGIRYAAPEGGLYSTAADMAAFYQMMLDGGGRILSPAAVRVMTEVHTGELAAGFAPGFGYGLTWGVIRNNDGIFRMNSVGSFGHGGAWRTYGWIDPQKKLVGVIMLQRISRDGDLADEINAVMAMSAAAIVDAPGGSAPANRQTRGGTRD